MPWSSPVLIWQSNIHFSMLKSSSLAVHRYRHELKHINTIIYTWINIQTKTRIYKLIYLINIHSIDDKSIHGFWFGRAIGFDPSIQSHMFLHIFPATGANAEADPPSRESPGWHQRVSSTMTGNIMGSIIGHIMGISWEYLGHIIVGRNNEFNQKRYQWWGWPYPFMGKPWYQQVLKEHG